MKGAIKNSFSFLLAIFLLITPALTKLSRCENTSDRLVLKDLVPATFFLLETDTRVMLKPYPDKAGAVTIEARGAAYIIEMLTMLPEGGMLRLTSKGNMAMFPFPEVPTENGKIIIKPRSAEPVVWFSGAEHIFLDKIKEEEDNDVKEVIKDAIQRLQE
jgi:hypothetical protein